MIKIHSFPDKSPPVHHAAHGPLQAGGHAAEVEFSNRGPQRTIYFSSDVLAVLASERGPESNQTPVSPYDHQLRSVSFWRAGHWPGEVLKLA